MAKPLKSTRADRRLKENKHLPPYKDKNSTVKNKRKEQTPPVSGNLPIFQKVPE